MGATEVIQGVSGSSMALILGVYHDLVNSLRSIDRTAFSLLRARNFGGFWKYTNGAFLLTVLSGFVIGVITLAKIITDLLLTNFITISSIFFGIILISGVLMFRKIKKWRIGVLFGFLIGFAINFSLTLIEPFQTADIYLFAFIAGVLAGFALLFPGLSSAFILLIIGKYQLIVISFSQLNAWVIILFVTGCVAGLWIASRLIHKILADYYSTTVALLAGLMLGALNKLWPWRYTFEYVTNAEGDQIPAFDESVVPWKYMALTGKDPQIFQAILMVALGVFLVVLIEKIAAGLKTKI
jgi:putative membrane protein